MGKNILIILLMLYSFSSCGLEEKEPVYVEKEPNVFKSEGIRWEKLSAKIDRVYMNTAGFLWSIDGDKVVYTASGSNYLKVYCLDLKTYKETIVTKEPGRYRSRGVYGNKVLVERYFRIKPTDFPIEVYYLYDLKTGKREWLFNKKEDNYIGTSTVYSNMVAYFICYTTNINNEYPKLEWDLIIYDIEKREKRKLTTVDFARVAYQGWPNRIGISDKIIAYLNNDKEHFKTNAHIDGIYNPNIKGYMSRGSLYICYYRFGTGKFERVPVFGVNDPEVSGSYILYTIMHSKGGEVVAYELSVYDTDNKIIIPIVFKKFKSNPLLYYAINGHYVVWMDPDSYKVHLYNLKLRKDKVLFKYEWLPKDRVFLFYPPLISEKYVVIIAGYNTRGVVLDVYKLGKEF